MLTARTMPYLISPQAVSTRSFRLPSSATSGISASNSMPDFVGFLNVTRPIGSLWRCWCSRTSGFLNVAPSGSMLSPMRSVAGVVAQPENVRLP